MARFILHPRVPVPHTTPITTARAAGAQASRGVGLVAWRVPVHLDLSPGDRCLWGLSTCKALAGHDQQRDHWLRRLPDGCLLHLRGLEKMFRGGQLRPRTLHGPQPTYTGSPDPAKQRVNCFFHSQKRETSHLPMGWLCESPHYCGPPATSPVRVVATRGPNRIAWLPHLVSLLAAYACIDGAISANPCRAAPRRHARVTPHPTAAGQPHWGRRASSRARSRAPRPKSGARRSVGRVRSAVAARRSVWLAGGRAAWGAGGGGHFLTAAMVCDHSRLGNKVEAVR